tara:strand:+ start:160 stop:285 length:126 start_codon:yes stop_codon:yes gene_type:complete
MESEALMEWWYIPAILSLGGFVTLLAIIISHIIEEYRDGRF